MRRLYWVVALCLLWIPTNIAGATPIFARAYKLKCAECHSGFPRLNEFGLAFKANGFRIPGAEKTAPMAWQKTVPLAVQIEPTYDRFSPGHGVAQFTDTQLLAAGLLTRQTSFYVHDSLWIDETPTPFPSYEVWVQQILDERSKLALKVGQFELPFSYSPLINSSTSFGALLFEAGVENNDVRLGAPLRGVQLSGIVPDRLRWYVASGAPSLLSTGNLAKHQEFLGEFQDTFIRVSNENLRRNIGFFMYFTNTTRNPNDSTANDHGQRYGIDGVYYWHNIQFYGMAVYGVNSNPTGSGGAGVLRSGFIEADKMIRPWFGLAGRLEAQTVGVGGARTYSDAMTLSARFYPIPNLRLIAEYQQQDHGRSATSLLAGLSF